MGRKRKRKVWGVMKEVHELMQAHLASKGLTKATPMEQFEEIVTTILRAGPTPKVIPQIESPKQFGCGQCLRNIPGSKECRKFVSKQRRIENEEGVCIFFVRVGEQGQ